MRGGNRLYNALYLAKKFASRVIARLYRSAAGRNLKSLESGAAESETDDFELCLSQVSAKVLDTPPPIFTVLIPTMDRAETVADAIRTCIIQDDANIRIVVSDNASTDNTAEVVRSFSDDRLSYINPGCRLRMFEHWEFALAHVVDGYITVLGDDDGLLPGAVAAARRIIENTGTRALSWQKIEYCWPNHIVPSFRHWLQLPLETSVRKMNSFDVVRDVIQFRDSYAKLPGIYNSFISTDLISSFRSKNEGRFFAGSIPDVYSAFAVASELDEFVFCRRPLSINGASGKSNGTLQTIGEKDNRLAKSNWADIKFTFEVGIPEVPIVELCILESFLKVGKVAKSFSPALVDKKLLIRSAVGGTFGGYIPESRRIDRLDALKEFARTEGLLELFEAECKRHAGTDQKQGLRKPGYYAPDSIIFDASMMEIDNVYSACLYAADILDLKARQRELFQQLATSRRGDIAVAAFVRSSRSSPDSDHCNVVQ